MVRYRLMVHGRVQRVGFRYYVLQSASLYGIRGWVKNKPDGTVEIDAEGGEKNMEYFIQSVRKGSRYSWIEQVEEERMAEIKNYESFTIEH